MYNKITIIGNLGKDPEFVDGEHPRCKFSLATTKKIKDENRVTWHNVVVFGKLAEVCGKYLSKGSLILVEGEQQNRTYDDKDGNKKFASEVLCNSVKFIKTTKNDQESGEAHSSGVSTADAGGADAPESELPF